MNFPNAAIACKKNLRFFDWRARLARCLAQFPRPKAVALVIVLLAAKTLCSCAASTPEPAWVDLPTPGTARLILLAPDLLDLSLVTTKKPDPARPDWFDFADAKGVARLPEASAFKVVVSGETQAIAQVGFKRRVLYAPLKQRDLRIQNDLYLKLAKPLADNQKVEVQNPGNKLWPSSMRFTATNDLLRLSPAIHVNQTGYPLEGPKQAIVGFYLGNLGELDLASPGRTNTGPMSPSGTAFQLVEAQSGKQVFQGPLAPRPDRGFPYTCYQKVWEADFSAFKNPGEYRVVVPGLGSSFPFFIDPGIAGAFARTYALGIYHQRCGTSNDLPFTRFTHQACHLARAEIPDMSRKFESVNESLQKESANYKENPRNTSPQLKDVNSSLYPFVNRGPVDVSGGHHDAGDYSKYTINSAAFIHQLVFAVDVFPGVRDLDNLGLPESGDGKSDVLQEAKWEADFLAKMQDADGGFYFLVYPRDREYETDVTPDHGDPQVVFPKTTSVTAAATAALAQCASSPTFKKQFPEAAARYLAAATKGWAFLQRAIAKYGKDGAYQKITHYGDHAMHDDELAWAACEMFLATGDPAYEKQLMDWFDPTNPETRLWSWLRLFDAYGCAVRSYAFAAKAGKIQREKQHRFYLEQCEAEIAATGEDQLRRSRESAYGISFPEETKRVRTAGWYFAMDAAFDLATACQLDYPVKNDPRPQMLQAIWSNLNYEQGCNPINITYLTGLGWRRQREIVHQYSQNDRRVLPLTGIPLGAIQGGFGWLDLYKQELGALSFPTDAADDPYPIYDRWGDTFNLTQEFVFVNQARALGCLAWLMAQSPLKDQPWRAVAGSISSSRPPEGSRSDPSFKLSAPGLDLNTARMVWEAGGLEPAFTTELPARPELSRARWIEAEAQLPDGRRVFAATNFPPSLR